MNGELFKYGVGAQFGIKAVTPCWNKTQIPAEQKVAEVVSLFEKGNQNV